MAIFSCPDFLIHSQESSLIEILPIKAASLRRSHFSVRFLIRSLNTSLKTSPKRSPLSTTAPQFRSRVDVAQRINCSAAYSWFASDVTAAMLVVKNKRVSLRWEMNSILMQILQKNLFCIDHQHGRLVTWLQTKNSWGLNSRPLFQIQQVVGEVNVNPERPGCLASAPLRQVHIQPSTVTDRRIK